MTLARTASRSSIRSPRYDRPASSAGMLSRASWAALNLPGTEDRNDNELRAALVAIHLLGVLDLHQ